jgi:aminoglycoside phosphotransferase family enzyme/predicted kinase
VPDRAFGPAGIEETHSAWVIFLGDCAYKLKKPVSLGFLDFSTREARERIVHLEVELNRRLAPDVYLGVADVIGPDGRVCDHLVVMRRMPADRRLGTLVAAGVPLDDELRAIARTVAAFHASAETSPEIEAAGSPEAIRQKVEQDLRELGAFGGGLLDAAQVAEVGMLVRRYLDGRVPLLEARVAQGHIRDGHGDLLADDIYCLPDGPRILDCIEFDDRLRHGDVLADVAFLAMDLERLGAERLANRFLAWYREFNNEHHPDTLMHYYVAFRALIRSKVACVRVTQGDRDASATASALLSLALGHLRRGQVRLVLVGGPPGTGKSTLSAALAERLGCSVLRSDDVRKDVTGLGRATRAAAPLGQGIYDAATSHATYEALLERARRALELGEPVILDASWSRARWRAAAARLADDTASDLVELCCEAGPAVVRGRIHERSAANLDVSDATVPVAEAMRASFEPWSGATVIRTDTSVDESIKRALDVLGG